MADETKAVAVSQSNSIVMPAVNSGKEAVDAWKKYEDVKASLLDKKTDIQVIGSTAFKKKSYWKKLGTFFNLTITVIEERKEQGPTDDPMDFTYHFTCRAQAPNGRFVDAVGSCSTYEKAEWRDHLWVSVNRYKNTASPAQPNTEHNVRSTACTRASNRAVSDLVAGGEASAEEISHRERGYSDEEYGPQETTSYKAPKTSEAAQGEVVTPTKKTDKIDIKADDLPTAAEAEQPISQDEAEALYQLVQGKGVDRAKLDSFIKSRLKKDGGVPSLSRAQYEQIGQAYAAKPDATE